MVLFLHNRYRTTGGEERTVEDLLWLVREHLGEQAELLVRAPLAQGPAAGARNGSARARALAGERARAAGGLLRGGLDPGEVYDAVRSSGARIVHAHNTLPTLGWRSLAAARRAGARVVVHLHQYRLVCAVGVCFTRGEDCTRCHGRDTLPGVRLNCRRSRPEALVYGISLALWQRRLLGAADALVVPSVFARERLRELGAPLPWDRVHVLAPPLRALAEPPAPGGAPARSGGRPRPGADGDGAGRSQGSGAYALVACRLSPEKGVETAIDACRIAGMPLVVAGEGPERGFLGERARGQDVRFVGRVGQAQLAELRAGAAIALCPSRSGESFGLAAAEAMAAGLPVAGCRAGALSELLEPHALVPVGDAGAMAGVIERLAGDRQAGERARERVRARCAPEVVARALADVYGAARERQPEAGGGREGGRAST